MATDGPATITNGNYAAQQGFAGSDANSFVQSNNTASSISSASVPQSSSTPSTAAPANPPNPADLPKEEIGWYFVESYYLALSRTPDRIYLFYNKRSQLVSGQETEKVDVCVGQKAISEKIKKLDFQDCKVRVTNVDTQASGDNIVIQVIGEISNKGQPHKKFTQTFVLGTQPHGYFVLNDIFRYLVEDEEDIEPETSNHVDESEQTPAAEAQEKAAPEPEPKTLSDPVAIEKVSKSLEEKILKQENMNESETTPTVNGDASNEHTALAKADEPSPTPLAPEATETTTRPSTGDSELKPEEPKDPEPTRTATPAAQPAAQPVAQPVAKAAAAIKPAAPAIPKTWANLAAAANKVAIPATPAAPASTTASKQSKSTTPVAAPTAHIASSTAAPSTTSATPSAPSKDVQDDEWTAVGSSHNRQPSRQTNAQPNDAQRDRGFIKSVMDHVSEEDLRAALEQFGELSYFDIARSPRNNAFVDFKTQEGFNKAFGSTFEINGDKFAVEKRQPPRNQQGYPRGGFQGARGGNRGGAGQGAPRGNANFSQANRGSFAGRGRGGQGAATGTPRGGRSQAQ